MTFTSPLQWEPKLADPLGQRTAKPRTAGKTMVIDKGLGIRNFEDLLQTSGQYIDMIKIGFGTSALYPLEVLQKKIRLAKENDLIVYPGGTFLEVAITHHATDAYFDMMNRLGFNGIEISDGTIEMDRSERNQYIQQGIQNNLTVVTEYGKKAFGSLIDYEDFQHTFFLDVEFGASMVTMEGRESGAGVGIYDEKGSCKDDDIHKLLQIIPDPTMIMWETPKKSQQVHLIKKLGPQINLGNIAPDEILSLESLRRGLRADTFLLP